MWAVKPVPRSQRNGGLGEHSVLPEATALGELTALLRHSPPFKICPANAPEARERGLWLNGGLGQPTVPERIRSSQSARSHSVRVPSAAPARQRRMSADNSSARSRPFASPDKRHPLRGPKASSRAPATNRDRISNGVATKSATVSGRPSRACRQSRHRRRSESGAADNQTWRCTV